MLDKLSGLFIARVMIVMTNTLDRQTQLLTSFASNDEICRAGNNR
jgi:hypothetical protein